MTVRELIEWLGARSLWQFFLLWWAFNLSRIVLRGTLIGIGKYITRRRVRRGLAGANIDPRLAKIFEDSIVRTFVKKAKAAP